MKILTRTNNARVVAEVLGTAMLTLVFLAVSQSAIGALTWFTAVSVGLTLAVATVVVGHASGGHFNPAVTLGAYSVRQISLLTAIVHVGAQLVGAMIALSVFIYLKDVDLDRIAGPSYEWRVVAAEMVGAIIFGLGVAAAKYRALVGWAAGACAGLSLALGIFVAQTASNGILNPAVALASNSWGLAYALGPVLGVLVGMNVYTIFFAPDDMRPKFLKVSQKKTTTTKVSVKKSAKKVTKKR